MGRDRRGDSDSVEEPSGDKAKATLNGLSLREVDKGERG